MSPEKVNAETLARNPEGAGLTPEDVAIPERPADAHDHVAKLSKDFTEAMLGKGNPAETEEAETPEATPAAGEAAAEETPEPAKTPTPEEQAAKQAEADAEADREWDKERQRKDQEAANERKAMMAELAGLKDTLAKAVAAKSEEPAKKAGDGAPDVEALLAEVENLDPTDSNLDGEQLGKFVKNLAKAVRANKGKGADPEVTAQLTALSQTVKTLTDRIAQQDAAAAQAAVNAEFANTTTSLDKQYGAHLHNAARTRCSELMAESGFTTDNPPPLSVAKALLRTAYAESALAATPGKKPPQRPARLPSVAGGRTAPSGDKLKPGSLDAVMAQIGKRDA